MNDLEKALTLAVEVHAGQLDRAGKPYILHPLRVMSQVESETEKIAAILHDVIEDSDKTAADLRELGFPDEVVDIVVLLSHDKSEESYDEYVRRLAPHPLARRIKIADLEHNMDIRRIDEVDEKAAERLQRYHRAWHYLHNWTVDDA